VVLRVRFHGRGGHGVKTASRILGTAGFLNGLQAQDCPVYGAERRGAPVAAYTRLDEQPIRERGVILRPDLILIADETLLSDPAAGALAGAESAAAVVINSAASGAALAERHRIPAAVVTLDLTALAAELLGRGRALSAPLGAAACALSGRIAADVLARAVREELGQLHLSEAVIEQNVEAARRVYAAVSAAPACGHAAQERASPVVSLAPLPGLQGVPVICAPGNSPARHTGAWRFTRPVLDRDVCTRCGLCVVLCPDGALRLDAAGYPIIDYDHCKGCMICGQECPVHGIGEEKETRAS
jgi:pyruvate ferredoxin oxidoreductase gamma subunit